MNSSKYLSLARLLKKPAGLSTVRNLSLTPRSSISRSRWPFNDDFFGSASNMMRNLEREFDFMRRQMDRSFKDLGGLSKYFLPISEGLESSEDQILVDKDGNRKFQIAFDMRDFKPEDIHVRTHGQNLIVSAKTEKKSDSDYYLREFSQSYSLPKELKLEDLKSKLTDDGLLTIEAPLPAKAIEEKKEKEIKIEHGPKHEKLASGTEETKK